MGINWTGLVSACSAFFGIWLGHVAVRFFEARLTDIRPAMAVCIALGLGLWAGALFAPVAPLSAALGILGVTFLWDAFEFYRQERRVRIGHAPANPRNPRHARILAECPAATPLDLLDRDPVGRPVTSEEAVRLVSDDRTKGRVSL
ncbi:MAG: DUF4491 family protein [Anaerolineales bacterium]|nr:DUF4491 family protein [Anaerolineales bacterium]MCX7754756.1 DUF4491 family protein [Anaerolineales bacterium]MDW8278498.1 DUF4491 family protein [Anaerolineales bacterium]